MFQALRRIRQNLSGKTDYKTLALFIIGELFLVVFGILIAVQIDDWYKQKETEEIVHTYLENLLAEYQENLKLLDASMQVNENNLKSANQLANIINSKNSDVSASEISILLATSFSTPVQYNPTSAVLHEMINSGDLKNIRNAELRSKLTQWEPIIERVKTQETILFRDRQNCMNRIREIGSMRVILDEVGASTNFLGLEKGEPNEYNLDLLDSRIFENDLLLFITTSKFLQIGAYNSLKEDIDILIDLIQTELDQE